MRCHCQCWRYTPFLSRPPRHEAWPAPTAERQAQASSFLGSRRSERQADAPPWLSSGRSGRSRSWRQARPRCPLSASRSAPLALAALLPLLASPLAPLPLLPLPADWSQIYRRMLPFLFPQSMRLLTSSPQLRRHLTRPPFGCLHHSLPAPFSLQLRRLQSCPPFGRSHRHVQRQQS